jgi:hypothetical protein
MSAQVDFIDREYTGIEDLPSLTVQQVFCRYCLVDCGYSESNSQVLDFVCVTCSEDAFHYAMTLVEVDLVT